MDTQILNAITFSDNKVLEIANEQLQRILPIVKAHNGAAEVISASEEKLIIAIKGHCAGCPMTPITYGKILNKYLHQALPELKEIEYIEIK